MPRHLWIAIAVAGCTAAPDPNGEVGPHHPDPRAPAPSVSVKAEPSARPAVAHEGPLAGFYDALSALERGQRHKHVRIAWLGDSHAQADFWTGYIRRALQKRFGNGGPGFVHLGYKDYRHEGVEVDVSGSWRFSPRKPATPLPSGDGVFGLGGMLLAGHKGDRRAQIEL